MIPIAYLPSHQTPANYQAAIDALLAAIANDVGFEVRFETRDAEKGCTFHKLDDCTNLVAGFAIISCRAPCVLGFVPVATAEPKLFAFRHHTQLASYDKRRHNAALAQAREFLEKEELRCKVWLLEKRVRELTAKIELAYGNT